MNLESIYARRREALALFLESLPTITAESTPDDIGEIERLKREFHAQYKTLTADEQILIHPDRISEDPEDLTNQVENPSHSLVTNSRRQFAPQPTVTVEKYQALVRGSPPAHARQLTLEEARERTINVPQAQNRQSIMTTSTPTLADYDGFWLLDNRSCLNIARAFLLLVATEGYIDYLNQSPGYPFNIDDAERTVWSILLTFQLQPDGSLIQSPLSDLPGIYTLSADKNTLYLAPLAGRNQAFRYKRIYDYPPSIYQYVEDPNAIDWADSQVLFQFYNEFCLNESTPYALKVTKSPGFDYCKSVAIMEKLLNGQSIMRKAKVVNVWKTQRPTEAAITTLLTKKEHRFNCASLVHVSGFTGDYIVLNREHPVLGRSWAFRHYPKGFVSSSTELFMIDIPVDTSSLPVYDEKIHGRGKIYSILEPITSNSLYYRQMMDAIIYSMVERGIHTHDFIVPIGIRKAIGTNNQTVGVMDKYTDYNPNTLRFLFSNSRQTISDKIVPNYFGFPSNLVLINNPLRYNFRFSFAYPITLANYLINPKKIQWTIDPSSPTEPYLPLGTLSPVYHDLVSTYGYPANGSRFKFRVVDYDAPPSDDDVWRNLQPTNDFEADYYIAQVNPIYTGGKNVGVLTMKSVASYDPYGLMQTPIFNLKDVTQPFVQTNVDGTLTMRRLFGKLMKYMRKCWHIEKLIVDNRNNTGGGVNTTKAFGYIFGANRKAWDANYIFPINDSNAIPAWADMPPRNSDPPLLPVSTCFCPSELKSSAVFTGTRFRPAEIVFLTSTGAFSGGDLIAQCFLGDNRDGNLGKHTHCTIIGNIDGRFDGASGDESIPQRPPRKNPLPDELRPFLFNSEVTQTYISRPTGKWLTQFEKALKPRVLEEFSLDSLYQDTGYAPSKKPYLNGTVPIKDNPETYRDAAFEDAILWLTQPCHYELLHGKLQ